MRLATRPIAVALLMVPVLSAAASADVILGQVDTFEDGTTQGWSAGGGPGGGGHPAPPENIPDGGPGGDGDNYLLVTALGGSLSGSKLSAMNFDQWSGDYIGAGVTRISMHVRNFGPDDVSLRLLFAAFAGPVPTDIAITDAVFIAAGGDWALATFDIRPSDLIAVLGDPVTALSNTTELRLFHNPNPDFPGPSVGPPAINTLLGVDNIRATAVPEPSTASLLGAGAGLLVLLRRRRSGRSA